MYAYEPRPMNRNIKHTHETPKASKDLDINWQVERSGPGRI